MIRVVIAAAFALFVALAGVGFVGLMDSTPAAASCTDANCD